MQSHNQRPPPRPTSPGARASDFYRPVAIPIATHIRAVSRVEREKAVRLYCVQHGQAWALQIRAPLTLRSGAEGKDFLVAHAALTREELVALRDAIDAHLKDGVEEEAGAT
jgi:hypothetical protein